MMNPRSAYNFGDIWPWPLTFRAIFVPLLIRQETHQEMT